MTNSSAAPVPEGSHPESKVAPTPTPKPGRTQGRFNKRQTAELNKAGLIATQAAKPAHLGKLAEQGRGEEFISALTEKIKAAGERGTGAAAKSSEGVSATLSSKVAKATLLRRLRQIQSSAKLKYQFTNRVILKAFLVGEPITRSRPLLEQSAQTLLQKAGEEKLAGIDEEFLARGAVERAAYVDSKSTQREKRAQAMAERIARDQFVESVKRDRMELQLAADGAWPAGVPENAAIRVLFFLNPKSAFNI